MVGMARTVGWRTVVLVRVASVGQVVRSVDPRPTMRVDLTASSNAVRSGASCCPSAFSPFVELASPKRFPPRCRA